VWEHLASPRETCTAAHELLATTRGHLLIVVPTFRRARTLAWSCFTAPHTYMFTEVSLGNLLEATGFDVVLHRYAAGADSELWLLARARPAPASSHRARRRESPGAVQRELVTVPLRAPLGLPGRLGAHVRTLMADPQEFSDRLARWSRSRLVRVQSALRRDA
jgi:hypothetical protein